MTDSYYIDVDPGVKLHCITLCYNMFLMFFFITRTTTLVCASKFLCTHIQRHFEMHKSRDGRQWRCQGGCRVVGYLGYSQKGRVTLFFLVFIFMYKIMIGVCF